ncbi:biotin-dependent carboxyltransferase family protein [Urechidicola sp. KH5]
MIEVLHPGLYTSIQDLGRFGYRNQGVPNSGVMDAISAGLANALLNNTVDCALLEMTVIGPKILFTSETAIAITGADMSPKLNDKRISNNKVVHIKNGDVLSFGNAVNGARCYLAVKGGIQSECVLNSRSQFKNITHKIKLAKNDRLEIVSITETNFKTASGKLRMNNAFFNTNELLVYKGPEFDILKSEDQKKVFNTEFTISNNSNRMGYQLNEIVAPHNTSIITSPVLPGTIQLLPSGRLIVLMKDAQTTGGYPRILQLSEKAISILAQKNLGDKVRLELI